MLAEYSEALNLQTCLLTNYSRLLNPSLNQSDDVSVEVQFYLNSVIDFKPVTGILSLAGAFILFWDDDVIGHNWQGCASTNVKTTKLSIHDVWIPQMYIRNAASSTSIYQFGSNFNSEMVYVTYNQNGSAKMYNGVIMDVLCKTDVTYYPLDTHECGLTITATNDPQNIQIFSTISILTHPYTYQNSEWDIDTKVINRKDQHISEITFGIQLSRKPTFVLTNLVFPVMVITVVIGFSFLIPIESGERLSFGISLLLMFIVFLTTVVDILPSTDNALSYFNSFIFFELIYSCMIVLGIIMTLYLYYHTSDSKVPVAITRFTKYVLKTERKISPVMKCGHEEVQNNPKEDGLNSENGRALSRVNCKHTSDITWKDVARAFDKVFRIITSFMSLLLILVFLVIDISVKLDLH